MSSAAPPIMPPDRGERERALDAGRSILVQAPAGSGKTDLLTRRFLRLLGEVDGPGQIVAITFTKAAAAEMRHRILSKLEAAAAEDGPEPDANEFSMASLAARALARSQALGWNLLDLPAQLRISTIDAFCRDLALQQPLLSGLGGGLDIAGQPADLYRRAARRTLEQIGASDAALSAAIEALLLWRDNGWQEMKNLLVEMLSQRDRWMHDFVLDREQDWDQLRARLERPFQRAVAEALTSLSQLLDQVPGAREEALDLARFACEEPGEKSPWDLAQCTEIPAAPFTDGLDSAREAFEALAAFLQTQKGIWRSEKGLKTADGFPSTPRGRAGKARFASFIAELTVLPGLESALAAARSLPPACYTDEDWQIVHACFALLRRAAAELKVVFAEAAAVDYIEVAQIAENVLKGENGFPADAAIAVADGIPHLLVDEFQDTSRRQHQLLAHLIAAWPEREGRTCFVVGDPMQSIYFFRDADAELFPRVRENGLELPHDQPLLFDSVALTANFRTTAQLVARLNGIFELVFEKDDGSGVTFSAAEPARDAEPGPGLPFELHLNFAPQATCGKSAASTTAGERESARADQIEEIVQLIASHRDRIEQCRLARERGEDAKYRIAVLGRTRSALVPIAEALHQAGIKFRAVDLENLKDRPEILDALALAHALLNPQDRVAWLGVLRAPWCGLSLADLHTLVSANDEALVKRPVPELLAERKNLLSGEGRAAAQRVLRALDSAPSLRFAQPAASLGTWIEQFWLRLGGDACVDATARANLDLLWRSLDDLPNGEQDLLGPALDAALDKLTAQPDPEAGSECGVQLMTIHKSKGLEFEVVIVPDLQARAAQTRGKLLSWLERGLPPEDPSDEPDGSGEITEFLIAPLQSKGADRGKAKAWVDRVYRERESQEMRRILYVAATRAREELHLFARPAYKMEKDGSLSLAEPKNSLLETAWPALEDEIRRRFDEWQQQTRQKETEGVEPEETTLESLAASGDSNLRVMPTQPKPTLLRRLPPTCQPAQDVVAAVAAEPAILGMGQLYERHEGGLLSRALGIAVHTLLQELARMRQTLDWEPARAALSRAESRIAPRIAAQVRAAGVESSHAGRIAAQALSIALQATRDPVGQWILSPRAEAASEIRWAGVVAGSLHTVQVDRVFQAGTEPLSEGNDAWWVIDYKTAHEDGLDPAAALPDLRRLFAPQIEAYARILRNLHGAGATVRAGLYYPRMTMFDWWEID